MDWIDVNGAGLRPRDHFGHRLHRFRRAGFVVDARQHQSGAGNLRKADLNIRFQQHAMDQAVAVGVVA